ncbi:MAG: cyclase family protein [Alphaproteobacteria bacterium]|nr:cyclase family protein [Alphaproteobacteria bacterium]
MNPRWTRRPEGSNWGDFGPDDQLGRLNLLTPARVLAAVAEVKVGRVFCLSLPLDLPGKNVVNPRRNPPLLFAAMRGGRAGINYQRRQDHADYTDCMNDDIAVLYTQYSTQWDALCHAGGLFDADGDGVAEPLYYNGYRAHEHVLDPVADTGSARFDRFPGCQALALGIETMAATGVQGRGVMIDLEAHFGRGETKVGYDQLMRVLDADKVAVGTGDLVCFRAGYDRLILAMNGDPDPERLKAEPGAALDGRDQRLLRWITDCGMVALITDRPTPEWRYEDRPAGDDPKAGQPRAAIALHEHCLFKLGLPIAELWHLSELADWLRAAGRSRFLLTAPPLRLPGAVGSPATPVATV